MSGAALAAIGLGVTGAYLGTPLSFIAMGVYCTIALRRYAATVESSRGPAPPGRVRPVGTTSSAPGRRSPGWP